MASPEKSAVDDWQLRFVFGNTAVVRPPEDAADPAADDSVETLCLSRSQLKHVPARVLNSGALKYLSLEGNQIFSVPGSMFSSLPELMWLDLRKNHIVSLPSEIGSHRSLKTLLLEGNPLSELPLELGNVITLHGLNLRDCPIRFPPQSIVHQGVQCILRYLRRALAERAVSVRKTPPAVEKLQLSELTGSSVEEQEDDESADELQRFWELKNKLILLDQAELGGRKPKSAPPPGNRQKKAAAAATAGADVIPELFLTEERRPAADRQLKQEQAALQQKRKSPLSYFAPFQGIQGKKAPEQRQKKPEEQQICAHVEKVEERHGNPRGTAKEQMAAAEEDADEMRKLQDQLMERRKKKTRGRELGKCFPILHAAHHGSEDK